MSALATLATADDTDTMFFRSNAASHSLTHTLGGPPWIVVS